MHPDNEKKLTHWSRQADHLVERRRNYQPGESGETRAQSAHDWRCDAPTFSSHLSQLHQKNVGGHLKKFCATATTRMRRSGRRELDVAETKDEVIVSIDRTKGGSHELRKGDTRDEFQAGQRMH
jgi:hypothetical protein